MRVLIKAFVLCVLIAAAVPVFAANQFTMAGRIGDSVDPEPDDITFQSSANASQRLFRNGGPGSTCDSPKPPPTEANVTGNFRQYRFNFATTPNDECVTVRYHYASHLEFSHYRYSVAAYSPNHDTDNVKTNLIGYAQDWVSFTNRTNFFSFRKPAGQRYVLVFWGIENDASPPPFHIEVSSSLATTSDFDGDGVTDSSVFRPSTGAWYTLRSSDATVAVDFFGSNGDVPLDGDFDGDGKSDLAIFRPSNGTWYYKRSHNGSFYGAFFGLGTDKPIPGDYDRDGITDIGAFRDGQWLISPSSGGATPHTTVTGYPFGSAGDIPVGSQRK